MRELAHRDRFGDGDVADQRFGRLRERRLATAALRAMTAAPARMPAADTATGTAFALTKNRLTPTFSSTEQVAGIVSKAVAKS